MWQSVSVIKHTGEPIKNVQNYILGYKINILHELTE